MTTEELVEDFIEAGVKVYKKNYKNCPEGIKIYRHEPVVLQGIEFNCWREYAVYKMGQYIQEVCPEIGIEIELDGNNSVIKLDIPSDEVQQKLNSVLYNFLKKVA